MSDPRRDLFSEIVDLREEIKSLRAELESMKNKHDTLVLVAKSIIFRLESQLSDMKKEIEALE